MDSEIGDVGNLENYNLFAYCNNNPVNLTDENGNWPDWKWQQIASGILLVALAVSAISIGILTLPFGGAIAVVAGITIAAGIGTAVFGVAEVGEGLSGYNIVRDTVFGGNQDAYNITLEIFRYTAIIGSFICGIYGATHITTTERSLPSNGNKHSGIWNKNDNTLGYYGKDGKLRYSIAFIDHGTPSIHNIPHWHTELPHSKPINNVIDFIIELIKRRF